MKPGNSFTFLRLAFALAVVFGHSFSLGGFGADPVVLWTNGQVQIGSVAVICFFVISGFLITGSALRQPSLWRFALNRAARILPGFWAVQLLTVFVLTPAIMLPRYWEQLGYWDTILIGPNSAFSYLCLNAGFRILQYPITDLFHRNPGTAAVNGSLWSLAPEVTCYVYLGLFAAIGGLRWKFVAPILFMVVYGLHAFSFWQPEAPLAVARVLEKGWIFGFHLPLYRSVFLAFLAGMTCFQYREVLSWRGWIAALAGAGLIASACGVGYDLVWPFALPYLVLYLAHRLPFGAVEQWGDFSYGIYIYAFPIQQCLSLASVQRLGFVPYVAASVALSVLAGVVSWRWVEQPLMQWARRLGSRRVVQAEPGEIPRQLELLPENS